MRAERDDVDALVRALERAREIVATEPIASAVGPELLPGPGSDVKACIRETVITTRHPACSVAMGSHASALPRIPRANTNAPSIMIGERCADFLLAQSATPTPRR
ncbi:GMC oxidoreductase [Mycobacterium ulcerans]|uniref:GMC oxidoreductase n=1 Tax=Mycobacterium ulcerans TaxID=1809 RepID=UPI00106AE8BD|nr:GMC oxidoreductase [Mycobacterium ulcerans]